MNSYMKNVAVFSLVVMLIGCEKEGPWKLEGCAIVSQNDGTGYLHCKTVGTFQTKEGCEKQMAWFDSKTHDGSAICEKNEE